MFCFRNIDDDDDDDVTMNIALPSHPTYPNYLKDHSKQTKHLNDNIYITIHWNF